MATIADIRVGTAGWSIPRAAASHFSSPGTHLERYALRLDDEDVAANDEFLPAVDPHFLPGTRPQTTLVAAVQAFRHQTLKALGFHGLNQYGKRCPQRACVPDRISQPWKNLVFQKLSSCR
jgi:hypothetical protein